MTTVLILLGGTVVVIGVIYVILFYQWNRD